MIPLVAIIIAIAILAFVVFAVTEPYELIILAVVGGFIVHTMYK